MKPQKYQLLCICSNSESCIYRTITSWLPYVHKVSILINNCNDNTENEILRACPNAVIFHGPFTGFADTRNTLLRLSYDEEIHFNIFIDDSYELVAFKNIPPIVDIGLIIINTREYSYHSSRILKMDPKIVYEGTIHETVVGSGKKFLINGFEIYDRYYTEHMRRSVNRAVYDLSCLESLSDSRSNYYRACCFVKLNEYSKAIDILKILSNQESIYKKLSVELLAYIVQYKIINSKVICK